jgi:hypothetical protein
MKGRKFMSIHKLNDSKDKKGTFIVEIQHQEKGSWQGKVTWAEGGRKEVFRSTLELIKMMDSAVNEAEEADVASSVS